MRIDIYNNQEDKHSYFSANTYRDIVVNVQGLNNVCTGLYTWVDGSVISGMSITDLVALVDEDLFKKIDGNKYKRTRIAIAQQGV